jgi:hypothetical protein
LIKSPARREVGIGGKHGDGAMKIDDEARNRRRLLRIGGPGAAEEGDEGAENHDWSQG